MNEWWQSLDLFAQIYWAVAFISSLLFLVVIGMTMFGTDTSDFGDGDFDGGIDFQFLNFKNTVGFFTIFAWTGLACIYSNASGTVTVLVSLFCGLVMMFLMAGLFYLLQKAGQNSTLKIENMVGLIGEVYIPVEKNRSSMGKVHVKAQGSLRELDAITDLDEDLKTGSVVKIKSIVSDHILLIEKA